MSTSPVRGLPVGIGNRRDTCARVWDGASQCHPAVVRWRAMKLGRAQIVTAAAVMIGAGAMAILRQALTTPPSSPAPVGDFSLGRWIAGTEFPGLALICVGAFLLCVAGILRP